MKNEINRPDQSSQHTELNVGPSPVDLVNSWTRLHRTKPEEIELLRKVLNKPTTGRDVSSKGWRPPW